MCSVAYAVFSGVLGGSDEIIRLGIGNSGAFWLFSAAVRQFLIGLL
jgi:hypothetical protein